MAGSAAIDDRRRSDFAVFGFVHERSRSDTTAGTHEEWYVCHKTRPQKGTQGSTENTDQDQESVLRERRRWPTVGCETILEHLRQHQESAEGGQARGSGRAAAGICSFGAAARSHSSRIDAGNQQRSQQSSPTGDYRGRGGNVRHLRQGQGTRQHRATATAALTARRRSNGSLASGPIERLQHRADSA